MPHFPAPLAVDPINIFDEMHETQFKVDTMYFVSALYKIEDDFGDIFGVPETCMKPLVLSIMSD